MNQTLFCLLVVVYAHVSFLFGNAAQSPICRIVDSQQDQRTAPRRTLCPAAHAVSTQWTLYHPSERIETLSAKPKAARKKPTSKKHKLAHVPTCLSHQEIHKTSRAILQASWRLWYLLRVPVHLQPAEKHARICIPWSLCALVDGGLTLCWEPCASA